MITRAGGCLGKVFSKSPPDFLDSAGSRVIPEPADRLPEILRIEEQ
jgi:hypothetical protein